MEPEESTETMPENNEGFLDELDLPPEYCHYQNDGS
jgi:hypothetical protein